jgi:ribosome-associated protein
MNDKTFQLKEGQEYIQLNNLLKLLQIAQTGGHAKIIIQNKQVKLNGEVETRVRKKLYKSDLIEVENYSIKIS